ncbi:MAG: cation diffusion facilitator family transporter [Proteobacteria bacterium]|nr:cation diffusion facilitator family transporter [Pseudomonadota bacterium]
MAGPANSLTSILFALGANLAIFSAKLVAALYTGSGAMLAEAIHSLADSGNQLLLIVGLRGAKRPPNDEHPLGYGKDIYFWSFIVAVILFSMGGMFSVYEGIHKIQQPEALTAPWLAIAVLVFSILAESVSLWGCLREVNKTRGDRSLVTWFKESRESELLVVFGEDVAALLGLALALIGVSTAMLTGNPLFDALGSIAIGILLILVAVMIGVEVKQLLIGQGVDPQTHTAIMSFLVAQKEINQVFNLITLQLGHDVMLAVKAEMQQYQNQMEMIQAINSCEKKLKEAFPQIAWCFFEPDFRD